MLDSGICLFQNEIPLPPTASYYAATSSSYTKAMKSTSKTPKGLPSINLHGTAIEGKGWGQCCDLEK
jgi:hypothetical protein